MSLSANYLAVVNQEGQAFEQYDEYTSRERVQNEQLRSEIERVLVDSSLSRPDQITEILNIVSTQQPSIREQYLQNQGSREPLHSAPLGRATEREAPRPEGGNPVNRNMPTSTSTSTSWEQPLLTEMFGSVFFSTENHPFPYDRQMTDSGFDSTSRHTSTTTAHEQHNLGIGEHQRRNSAHGYDASDISYVGHQPQVPDYPEQINPSFWTNPESAELDTLLNDEHINSELDHLEQG